MQCEWCGEQGGWGGGAVPVHREHVDVADVFDGRQLPPGDDVVDEGGIESARHLQEADTKRAEGMGGLDLAAAHRRWLLSY